MALVPRVVFKLFNCKIDSTRVASKINNEGKTVITKSLIDHFATNRVRHILKSEVIQIGMVDHYLIIGTRKIIAWRILQKCQKTVETRMLKNYNKDEFLFALHSIDFITSFSELSFDPNQMTASFHEIFESLLNLHAPLAKGKIGICHVDKLFDKRTHAQA